jgi:hypothetical protein
MNNFHNDEVQVPYLIVCGIMNIIDMMLEESKQPGRVDQQVVERGTLSLAYGW